MKNLVLFLLLIFQGTITLAQAPQSFRYQAVARDNSGNVLANQTVSFRISILSGSITGTVTYSETHTGLSTNTFGLVELEIGKGTPVTGSFSTIDWGTNSYFVKIEMDPAGGSAYQVLSTSQLLSVPYALHANTVQTGDNWGADAVQTDATLSGNGTVSTPLLIANNGITSAKIQNGAVTSGKLATNSVTTDKINSGAVTGAKISQAGATTGQILKWNGTTWSPAPDETDGGLILPFSGTGTSGSPLFNIVNLGTSGAISTLSSGNYGIWGESSAIMGIGVYGVNKTSSGKTFGVFGDVYSPSGYSGYFQGGKVFIQGNTGIGIQDPSAKLEVAGQVKITGGSPGTGKVLTSDGAGLASWQTPVSTWLKNGSNLYYSSGNVGIGLDNPTGKFEIQTFSDDNHPTILLNDELGYSRISFRTMSASSKRWTLAGFTNDELSQFHINYNDGSVDKNLLTVLGDSRINLNADVGIGTNFPSARLEVDGQVKINGGSPGTGKVLTSDANGLASWQMPSWISSGSNVYYNSGSVGIGTSTPVYKLTIYDANNSTLHFLNSGSGTGTGDGFIIQTLPSGNPVWIWNFENSNMHFGTNNANRMIINADGHVSMMKSLDLNTESTFGALHVNSAQAVWYNGDYFSWGYGGNWNYFADKIYIGPNAANPGTNYLVVNGDAAKPGGGSWLTWSDVRLKNLHGIYSKGLEEIAKLNPIVYSYKKENHLNLPAGINYAGLIAQEVAQIFPESVSEGTDGFLQFDINAVNIAVINAIKELKAENDNLKTENQQLRHNFNQLNTRLERLEKLISCSASDNE